MAIGCDTTGTKSPKRLGRQRCCNRRHVEHKSAVEQEVGVFCNAQSALDLQGYEGDSAVIVVIRSEI
jgi:hypothetical protein